MQEWWILQFVAVQSLFSNKPMHLGKMEGDWLDKNQRGWWPKSSFLAHNTTPKLTQDTISAQKKVHTNMIFEVLYPSSPSSFAHGTPHSCRLFFFCLPKFLTLLPIWANCPVLGYWHAHIVGYQSHYLPSYYPMISSWNDWFHTPKYPVKSSSVYC